MSRPQFGHIRRACIRCAAALRLVFVAACGKEQGYPARPVNLIVPFPAGGSSDLIARVVSERAGRALGQQLVIENRPGAGGGTPEEFRAHIRAETRRWGELVRARGIRAEELK